MKKKIIILGTILFFFLSLQGLAQGQRSSFHANVGIAFPKEENIKSGFESGFGFSLPLSKKMSLAFDFGYWKSTVHEKLGKLFNGKLSINPFLFSLHYALAAEKFVVPYIFLGSSLIFTTFKIGKYISIPEITINQKVENGIGVHLGSGANVKLTMNLALFGEISYLYRKAKGKTIITDMNFGVSTKEFSINLGSLQVGLGMKYFF
jgi:hypothetical protein